MHVHTVCGQYLRSFKPIGEMQIYDLDALEQYLFLESTAGWDEESSAPTSRKNKNRTKRLAHLQGQVLSDIDSIKKIKL
jgi:hypothetical protein